MKIFLGVLAVISFLCALAMFLGAHSAAELIGATILCLVAAVLLAGAAVVEAINAFRDGHQATQGELRSNAVGR
jgi:hypothetical protein